MKQMPKREARLWCQVWVDSGCESPYSNLSLSFPLSFSFFLLLWCSINCCDNLAHFNCQLRQKATHECNCCCNFSLHLLLLLHIWIMNAATWLQPAFCCLFIFITTLPKSLCRLIDHKYLPALPLLRLPSPFSHTLCQSHIWHGHSPISHRHRHIYICQPIANWNYVAANVWIVNVF